jgi:hypothetical protein
MTRTVAFYHITDILSSNETWNRRLIDKPITTKHSLIIGAITMEICTHNSLSQTHTHTRRMGFIWLWTSLCKFIYRFTNNLLTSRITCASIGSYTHSLSFPGTLLHYIVIVQGVQKVSVHLTITVQYNWWFEDGNHRTHSKFGPCYTERGLRKHSSACQ